MFRLVFLVSALTSVLCQDCVTQMTTCMGNAKTAHEAEMKAKMAEWKTKMDTMKTNADQCFTK